MWEAASGRPCPRVDGERLAEILGRIDAVPDELLRGLAHLIRFGRDEDIVLINPVRFAELHRFETDAVVSRSFSTREDTACWRWSGWSSAPAAERSFGALSS